MPKVSDALGISPEEIETDKNAAMELITRLFNEADYKNSDLLRDMDAWDVSSIRKVAMANFAGYVMGCEEIKNKMLLSDLGEILKS